MDIISEPYIAIGNRFLAELRRVGDFLKKHSEAIDKQNIANNKDDRPTPVLRAELQIPESVK